MTALHDDNDVQGPSAAFSKLIAPVSASTFFGDIWEKRAEVINRGNPGFFHDLITLDDVDHAITTLNLSFPEIRLVSIDNTPERAAYTKADGRIIPAAVMRGFADGATIVLNQMQRRMPNLGQLCLALEKELGVAFQTNLYLSPPFAGGFKTHYDTHDVFVLQLAGSKEWELYESALELPLPGQVHDEAVPAGACTRKFVLEQGDVAYIPRGIYHAARSASSQSLHVTLGALSKTWCELFIEALSELALRDVEFRRALPIGFGVSPSPSPGAQATFHALLQRFAAGADFGSVVSTMVGEFVRSRDTGLRGQLHEIGKLALLDLETVVIARPEHLLLFRETGDIFEIRFSQTVLELPAHTAASAKHLLSGKPVKLRALEGTLDDEGKIALARRLIKEGLLRCHLGHFPR